ncbi:membrane-associated PAP2 superfamily phosphatase [Saccharothrix tamanrassetensis]|uniref:Membrane-associated PAP2 superfamily phosphatase n=1 Tax=Saccharothrix tamanrassetensis TaxID=1051531 RepID=A0A841CNM4_9PSEU|nr:hypothetical protein [Saccharothrix tamanrassetensis]MBB5958513.1 membrane-associated PAP2 superfamily phosphatase [Saccharothrix tamanrassetensis]
MGRRQKGRRLALLCVVIALVPLVLERRAGRLPCSAESVVVVAAVLLAAVPRAVVRLAAAFAEPAVPVSGESCP